MRFFDTNILVYAASNQDPRKRAIALDLLRHALEVNHDGVISLQILQEFTNVMLKRSLATDEQIEGYYSYFYRLVRSEVTSDMLRDAIHIRREYGINRHGRPERRTALLRHGGCQPICVNSPEATGADLIATAKCHTSGSL